MTAATRAMLNPCSPPGSPQPTIRSSTWDTSSCGTLASTAVTIWVSRSSGLMEVPERLQQRAVDEGECSVQPPSGNTAVGLSIIAQERGYHCVFTCPDKVAADKIAVLRAYGAEVVVCPTSVAPDHPSS